MQTIFGENTKTIFIDQMHHTVADPGFPYGGVHPLGGAWTSNTALFSENICKNERIRSHRGRRAPGTPPRSANATDRISRKNIVFSGII